MGRCVPQDFDIEYFCDGLRVILEVDHHQVVLRVLNMLFNAMNSFVGHCRDYLVSTFLIEEQFFRLFLHWDIAIRNVYHQLLLYKCLRVKYSLFEDSDIYTDGNVRLGPAELALDIKIYAKLKSCVRVVEDQTRNEELNKHHENIHVAYAPKALAEYKCYLSIAVETVPTKLLPLCAIQERRLNLSKANSELLTTGSTATVEPKPTTTHDTPNPKTLQNWDLM